MSLIRDLLEIMTGKAHLYLSVGGTPAVEIILHGKEIVAEIKNPLLAMELGLEYALNRKKGDHYILKQIKAAGYKVKVKYMMLEFEI